MIPEWLPRSISLSATVLTHWVAVAGYQRLLILCAYVMVAPLAGPDHVSETRQAGFCLEIPDWWPKLMCYVLH